MRSMPAPRPIRLARRAGLLLATVFLAACGGGGGGGDAAGVADAPGSVRPAVAKEIVEGIRGPVVDGAAGEGYVIACPGLPDEGLPRNVLIVAGGFSPEQPDRRPAAGELERACADVGDANDHHTLLVRYRDGGATIQRNGGFVRAVVEWAIERYRLDASDRIVLQGASMGGLVTRYALQSMETDGRPHLVDLWVSVDAPLRGAYIPIGMQFLADLYRDRGGARALASIDAPAALQMLTHHYRQGAAARTATDAHRRLFDELDGPLGGFPRAPGLRRVGVASGIAGDRLQEPLPGERYLAGRIQAFARTERLSEEVSQFLCTARLNVDVPVIGTLTLEAFPLGLQAGQASAVARSRVEVTAAGFDIASERGRLAEFIDRRVVVTGGAGLCAAVAPALQEQIVARAVDRAISGALVERQALLARYDRSFASYGDGIHSAGAPGGRSIYVALFRLELDAAGVSSEPDVTGGGRHLFVSVGSALNIPGSTARIPPEGLRDASPFDEVYFETRGNLDHANSNSGFFAKEVLSLFAR